VWCTGFSIYAFIVEQERWIYGLKIFAMLWEYATGIREYEIKYISRKDVLMRRRFRANTVKVKIVEILSSVSCVIGW
jgi:hypothetical protein